MVRLCGFGNRTPAFVKSAEKTFLATGLNDNGFLSICPSLYIHSPQLKATSRNSKVIYDIYPQTKTTHDHTYTHYKVSRDKKDAHNFVFSTFSIPSSKRKHWIT